MITQENYNKAKKIISILKDFCNEKPCIDCPCAELDECLIPRSCIIREYDPITFKEEMLRKPTPKRIFTDKLVKLIKVLTKVGFKIKFVWVDCTGKYVAEFKYEENSHTIKIKDDESHKWILQDFGSTIFFDEKTIQNEIGLFDEENNFD